MKTLEKIVTVYLAILFIAIITFGILSVAYGDTLSIDIIKNFSYPTLPTTDMIDISLRLGGLAMIVFPIIVVCKKNIIIDWGCKAEYV